MPTTVTPLLVATAALLFSGCTRLFFYPTRADYSGAGSKHGRIERVSFASKDGTRLAGLWIAASSAPARGTVVHFHGNAENMTSHFRFADWLAGRGFNVLAFDYRGYGGSGGKPSVSGAVEDGIAAIEYASRRPETPEGRLVVLGQSLGGALAMASAASLPRGTIRALALDSAFGSYPRVARDKLKRFWLTWPLQWPLSALFWSRWSAERRIARLEGTPIVFIHGDADPVVPFQESERLFATAKEPKRLWRIAGAGHTEAFTRFGTEYRPRLEAFFAEAVAGGE